MRFFTIEEYKRWYRVYSQSEAETPQARAEERQALASYQARWVEYLQHVESLRGVLSTELIELATLPGIDASLIVELHCIHALQQIVLVLRGGNLVMGYYDLVLTYDNATMTPEHEQTLQQLAHAHVRRFRRGPLTGRMQQQYRKELQYLRHEPDLYRQEIDVTKDGFIEHRLIFHPGFWFAIRCRSLRWQKINRPNRDFVPHIDCF